jgi:hypothetical protein
MTRTLKLLLTAAVALYLVFVLAGLMCLAAVLPGAWALLTFPLGAWNGYMVADLVSSIWESDGLAA